MPNFELSISPDYVGSWGFKEAIREIWQNCLDQATVDPTNRLLFSYDPGLQVLKIGNLNSTLHPSTLVMGNTTKANDDRTIGQFGEGYKLAMVVLLRMGKSITIYNNPDVWTPTIKMSESFKTPILNINSVRYRFKSCPEEDLIFNINGVTPAEMKEIEESNLYFHEVGDIIETLRGRILLDPRYKGQIFVKGLQITTVEDAHYGYDFDPRYVKIGRDRDLLNNWDLFDNTSAMWAGVTDREELINDMLASKAPEVEYINYHVWAIPEKTVEYIGRSWFCENPGCIPCSSEREATKAREIHGADAKVVIVSSQLMAVLNRSTEFKNLSSQIITGSKPADLVRKVLGRLDNFKPSQQAGIRSILEMSKHWGWVKS